MQANSQDGARLDSLIDQCGLTEMFATTDTTRVDCPVDAAHPPQALRLNRRSGRVFCTHCGLEDSLEAYLLQRSELAEVDVYADISDDELTETNVVPLHDNVPEVRAPRQLQPEDDALAIAVQIQTEAETKAMMEAHFAAETQAREAEAKAQRHSRIGERVIMTLLAVIFLGAGLAAAGLSSFANYQAFSSGVTDVTQGRIWGWSGVIASICSFGGFTFFYWHVSARRFGEAVRALVFAIAGAATSIAGTAMFMTNNSVDQASIAQQASYELSVVEAQIEDWSRQLSGIPTKTRSVDGLKAYLAGVEAVGKTHEKPYRDAQNELGLAERRAELEAKISDARTLLIGDGAEQGLVVAPVRQGLPGWFFAVMLELFSSQGTSIAFVSLLLLYGSSARSGH